jgi:hypothetical protein
LTLELDREVFKTKSDTFGLFDSLVEDYQDKTILDFGGNHGNLIKGSNGKILKENYTCLDISRPGLDQLPSGVKSVHWNRMHPAYNQNGNLNEPFPSLPNYDIVFANSVFTHHSIEEMVYCIKNLVSTGAVLYFTYIDTQNMDFFENVKQYKPIYISDNVIKNMQKTNYYYILNHDTIVDILPNNWNDMWSIVNTEYLKTLLKKEIPNSVCIQSGISKWLNFIKISLV